MSPTSEYPDESVLLAMAAEDERAAPPDVRAHVAACPPCRRKLDRFRTEIDHLRSTVDPGDRSSPTNDGPRPASGGG